ncbi:MAG: hypothetical protein KJP12_05530 [Acidimicrobiia bacterium]|nr:hypothetical protein [Acidimicrobiia bacterium]
MAGRGGVVDLSPALVLGMWSAGLAAATAAVVGWRIVGTGYTWLAASVVFVFGLGAALAGGSPWAWVGVVLTTAAAFLVWRTGPSSATVAALAVAGAAFVIAATADSPLVPAMTGALFLGAVTAEMVLGHWYLVDPQLPRWALFRLAVAGLIGLGADFTALALDGALSWGTGDEIFGWAFVGLAAMTAVLMAGVWGALREPSYTGVMAATGLSYLAVLTALGVAVVGRALISV